VARPIAVDSGKVVPQTIAPEAAFEGWLTGVLQQGASALALSEGAKMFARAAGDSTFHQAKNALVQSLSFIRAHRPELVEPFFDAVAPWLGDRAKALPQPEQGRELEQIQRKSLEVKVSIPIPQDMLEEVSRVQRAAVDQLYAEMTAADVREEKSIRSQVAQQRVKVQGKQIEAARTQKVSGPKIEDAQWGAFLGRLISHASTAEENKALDLLVQKQRTDPMLLMGMKMSGTLDDIPGGEQWVARVSAGIKLAERCRYGGPKDTTDKVVMGVLAKSDATPTMAYSPLMSLKDGDIEALLFDWIKTATPGLVGPLLDNHPHFPRASQLEAVNAQLDTIAAEQGRFLENFNVLTVMHQMGRSVPWLQLLTDKLGMQKENYLGVSVPYSGSKLAEARLGRDGYETLADHDPRPQLLAQMQDTLGGGNPQSFDQLKEEDIRRAVKRMVEKNEQNGKPILIVDDGGYAAKVIRKYFPEHEDKFRIVEWTTRGIRQFEQIPDPKMSLISAAESKPKVEIEPAFIADSLIEHFRVALRARFPDLKDRRILVVGAGNIGRACALAAAELGAKVSMNDLKADRLAKAVGGTDLKAELDLEKAVKGKDAILAVTGANSLPPDIFQLIDPGTVVTSASSVDIETRDPAEWKNGTWGTDLSRLTVKLGSKGSERAPFTNPINESGAQALEASLSKAGAPYGLEASVERRDILAGGFVLNLGRRARVMPVQREELILLNVTEAIAQAAQTSGAGKHVMAPEREDRIIALFARHHPEDHAFALRFAADAIAP